MVATSEFDFALIRTNQIRSFKGFSEVLAVAASECLCAIAPAELFELLAVIRDHIFRDHVNSSRAVKLRPLPYEKSK